MAVRTAGACYSGGPLPGPLRSGEPDLPGHLYRERPCG